MSAMNVMTDESVSKWLADLLVRHMSANRHLKRMMGLAQMPIGSWTEEDRRELNEARQFIQQEEKLEGTGQKVGGERVGETTQQLRDQEAQGRVQAQGIPVPTRDESPGKPQQ
jgi:hypothetical protein